MSKHLRCFLLLSWENQQGPGLEVEQLGFELAPILNASIAGGNFALYGTSTPLFHVFHSLMTLVMVIVYGF